MARHKYKLSTQLHPDRYLIWAMVIPIIVAMALVSYIYIGNIHVDNEMAQYTADFWHTYKNPSLGITFRYPASWVIDVGNGYIGFGPNKITSPDAFLLYSYSPPQDPAYDSYLKHAGVRQISVNGKPGIRISVANGSSIERIAFVKTPRRLFEFRGTTVDFDQIISSIHFTK